MVSNKKLKLTVFAALLTSISVILKLFLGITVDMFGGLVKDINLSPTTVMFSGIVLGPVYGGLVGALTDILVFLVRPLGSYNPIFTLTNALMGILPALFFCRNAKTSLLRVSLATACAQILCSFLINTLTLIVLNFMPPQIAWFRALSTFIMLPLHIFLIYTLCKATDRYLPFLKVHKNIIPPLV